MLVVTDFISCEWMLRDSPAVCGTKHRPPSPSKLNSGRCRRRRLQHLAGKK